MSVDSIFLIIRPRQEVQLIKVLLWQQQHQKKKSVSSSSSSSDSSALGLIALVVGLLVLLAMGVRTISNTDFYTHLATGKAISAAGIGAGDTLSYVTEGQDWMKPNWLYERIMSTFGASAMATILHVIAVVAAFVLLIPVTRRWSSATSIGMALVVTSWLLAARFEPRAVLFSLIFPAIFVHILEKKKVATTWLPFAVLLPVQILWANIHTNFLIGPVIVIIYIVEANFRGKSKDRKARMTRLGALAAACLVVPVLNPNFVGLYGYVTEGWGNSLFSSSQFWVSPVVDEFGGRSNFPIIYVILIVGACGLVFYKEKLPLAATLLALVGAIIIVVIRRYQEGIELFTILLFPFLCLSLQSIGTFLKQQVGDAGAKFLPTLGVVLTVVLGVGTLASLVSNSYYIKTGSLSAFGLGANDDLIPAEAMEIINGPDFPERFLNLPMDGMFMALKSDGKKVFIDQRARLYGRDALEQAMKGMMAADPEATQEVYEKWQPEAIVINTCAPNAEQITLRVLSASNWKPAYFDGTTLILAADSGAGKKLLENTDLQTRGLEIFEKARVSYQESLGSMVAAPLPARLIGGASMLMIFKQYDEAYNIYELLKAGAPTMHKPYLQQGICKLNQDDPENALRSLLKAKEIVSEDPTIWQWLSIAYEKNGDETNAKLALENAKNLGLGNDESTDADEEASDEEDAATGE